MMKQFMAFVKKEFRHVLRDRKTLFILFGMPIAQILIFGFALTNEVKNARILVIDRSKDAATQQIISKIEASRYFEIGEETIAFGEIENSFQKGDAQLAVIFPAKFQYDLQHQGQVNIQIIADASDPNNATILTNYIKAVIHDYQMGLTPTMNLPYQIGIETRMLYNPQLEGKYNFVPGVMALVLLLVCVMMTAISIVKEKEMGTMEVLLVSPFRPILVILSKTFPYLLLSIVNLIIILLMSVYILDLPIKGSLVLLFLESILFIITCLALGMLISIKSATQQTAMLISLMGMLLPTALFSGFMFPIENMPYLLQLISNIVPSKWFYIIVKDIMIKGLGIGAVWKETLALTGMTAVLLAVSLKSFNIRLTRAR